MKFLPQHCSMRLQSWPDGIVCPNPFSPSSLRLSSRPQELIVFVAMFLSGKWTVHSNLFYKAHELTWYQPEFCLWTGPKSELMAMQRLRNNHKELNGTRNWYLN